MAEETSWCPECRYRVSVLWAGCSCYHLSTIWRFTNPGGRDFQLAWQDDRPEGPYTSRG